LQAGRSCRRDGRTGEGGARQFPFSRTKKERRDFARERANRAFHCVPNRHTQTLVTANEASVVQNTRAPFPFAVRVCTAPGNRSDSRIDCMTHRPGFGPVGPARLQSLAPGRFAAFDTTIVSLCPPPASRPVKGASAFGLPPTCFPAGKHLSLAAVLRFRAPVTAYSTAAAGPDPASRTSPALSRRLCLALCAAALTALLLARPTYRGRCASPPFRN